VVFGIATLSSGVALRFRPVHVSTMTFD